MSKRYFFFFILFIGACSSEKPVEEEPILARVGNATITEREFELNYEFGFNQLKRGQNAQTQYLDLMIAELLIAQEGFALQLDTAQHVQHAVRTIKEERLIEEVFNVNVLEQITVSEEEISEEMNKAAVSFQLRFLPAMSEPHAAYLKQQVELNGYDQAVAEYSNEMVGSDINETSFQTPFMTYDQIDPVLLGMVDDLELGEISDPIFYNNQWVLFMVNDIRRTPIAEEDYEQRRPTYEKVVYNRKAMQQAEVFISELMEPKNVSTKRFTFVPLARAFYDWFQVEIPVGNLVAQVQHGEESYHEEIREILNETLVTWSNQDWTVEDFLVEFNPARYQLRPEGYGDFVERFSDVVALVVRDYELLKMADGDKLNESTPVQRDIQQWENKWVFQSSRAHFFDAFSFREEDMPDYYELYRNEFPFSTESNLYAELTDQQKVQVRTNYLTTHLTNYANSLKQKYPVEINEELLAEILSRPVSSGTEIQTQLFKQNSNRLAFPIVDPNW